MLQHLYVDDLSGGASDSEEALTVYKEAKEILDPVYTRTDLNWYGSEMDPFQFFSSVYTGSDPNQCPFTLGTELE